MSIYLVIFPCLLIAGLGIIALLLKKKERINFKTLLLYTSLIAMIGPMGEILIDTFYNAVFGHPLWEYRILPSHNGYTSLYAPVIWGIAGAGIYLLHEIFKIDLKRSTFSKPFIFMFESIFIEALFNILFLVLTGSYIFYYVPGDLFHITSLQTLPFYFGLGLVVTYSIKILKKNPLFISVMSLGTTFVVAYLTH